MSGCIEEPVLENGSKGSGESGVVRGIHRLVQSGGDVGHGVQAEEEVERSEFWPRDGSGDGSRVYGAPVT